MYGVGFVCQGPLNQKLKKNGYRGNSGYDLRMSSFLPGSGMIRPTRQSPPHQMPAQRTNKTQPIRADRVPFPTAAEKVLSRLRVAFGRLLESAPTKLDRATDLQRTLGLDTLLGWQIFRLAGAADPFTIVQFIPGPGSMTRVLRLAKEKQFSAAAISEADAAHTEFLQLIQSHAGDRETFDTMVAGLSRESPDPVGPKDRRAGFRISSRTWGFQAKARYACGIYHPSATPCVEDAATISGVVLLRQLRSMPSVPLIRGGAFIQTGLAQVSPMVEGGDAILYEYSTKPLPTIVSVADQSAYRHSLQLTGVGLQAGVDCFVLNFQRGVPGSEDPDDPVKAVAMFVTTPCELLVIDLLIPRGWADLSVGPRASTFGNAMRADDALTRDPKYELPIKESAVYLGTDMDALHETSIPSCPEMVGYVLDRLDMRDVEYDIFRCRVQYPIMHTLVCLGVSPQSRSSCA